MHSFLNSLISVNHDKVEGHSANGKILIQGIDNLIWNLFYLSSRQNNPIVSSLIIQTIREKETIHC